MDTQIIVLYCLCDDYLKGIRHREDRQVRLQDAEIMTIALVAVLEFRGNFAAANRFMYEYGYVAYALSRSRFSRRVHQISDHFVTLFSHLAEVWKTASPETVYALDTFPISVCDNSRISRCRLYQGAAYRGYQASKKRYFYGLKVHLMVTHTGHPIEFFLSPGATGDVSGLPAFDFDLPAHSHVVADKAYNDYLTEDLLDHADIHFRPFRKKNSKRPLSPACQFLQHFYRKSVETTASLVERLLPKSIHATSPAGFELKLTLFLLAVSFAFIPAL